MMTADDLRTLLRTRCDGNQADWAIRHGISKQYVSDILNGRREPGPLILEVLGLRKVVAYEKIRTRGTA